MTNEELEWRFTKLVKTERKITLEVLRLVGEATRRRHYLERGFGSTMDWLTRGHGYSHAAASRRIQAARLLVDAPECAALIESGLLNITVLAMVQSALWREELRTNKKIPIPEKQHLVGSVIGKTQNEAEGILRERFPNAHKKEVLRKINGEESRMALNLSKEGLENLSLARNILSHIVPSGSWSEVVAYLAKDFVRRKNTARKKSAPAAPSVNSTNSPSCQFRDPQTGRVCGSRYQLQEDHITPRALGGTDEPANLRTLCRKHNILEAECAFGKEFMDQFRRH